MIGIPPINDELGGWFIIAIPTNITDDEVPVNLEKDVTPGQAGGRSCHGQVRKGRSTDLIGGLEHFLFSIYIYIYISHTYWECHHPN